MSRLGGPRNRADEKDQDSRTTKKSDDANGDDDGARQGLRRGSGRVVADLLPPPGSFRPNEVLAINLSAAGLAKARQLNFTVGDTVVLPALGLKVTPLETPSFNAVAARTFLADALPKEEFNFNRIYVAGRLAPAGTDAAPKSGVPGPMPSPGRPGLGCGPDRCFAPSVINWQPQLAACARGIRIGVIDTGIDKTHPAFAGVSFEHKDFAPRNGRKPSSQHGTGVFSLLAGNPKSSTPGLVHEATFFVGDAFFADGSGNPVSDTMTMLRALDWLKSARVDVANLSFAGPEDGLVHEGIRALARAGTAILAAAGNEGPDAPKSYPAGYSEVIAVTAVDRKLSPYLYANRGSHIDVAAPGVDVWTAMPNRREGPQTGTSFAVPFVTSVVALSYRADERTSQVDPLEPKQRALALLQGSIKPLGGRGRSPVFGAGLVQAPANCEPRGSTAAVASARHPETNSWAGTVRAVPAAAIQPQAGPWVGTIQRHQQ